MRPGRVRPGRVRRGWAAAVGVGGLAVIVGGCIGPHFQRPSAPRVERFTETPLPAATATADSTAQAFLAERDVPRDWWTLFGSSDLDELVAAALRANPDVQAAQAALRQARENTAAQRGSYAPAVQASFQAQRNRDATGVLSPNLSSGTPLYDLFTPQVVVSYVPDIFGANRRQVESLAAQAEATRYQLDATYLTLVGNVVAAAFQEASLRGQIEATQRVIALEQESLGILRRELELGAVAEGDIYALEAALANLQATLPPLAKQQAATRDQLAVLSGRLPAELPPLHFELAQLTLPRDLPLGVPSQLVERRPDVRAAEAQMHVATAQVGIAITHFLPQLTLTSNLGATATAMQDLFKAGTGFWSIGATGTQTLFQGGTLLHQKRAADAGLQQAEAQYRSAVLTAFQNVADALHALEADADGVAAADHALDAAQKSWDVTRRQVELGSVSHLALLAAEQAYSQAQIAQVQSRASRFADTAALFQALGGSVAPLGAD